MSDSLQWRFERTDIWREGKWIDLWSVVHFLSGALIGLGLYFLQSGAFVSIMLVLVLLVAYEMWEMLVQIQEAPTNRFMDVVVGMASFLPAFFLLAPILGRISLVIIFGLILAANVVMSILGWRASQKAAELQRRMRVRYVMGRKRLLEQKARLRKKFRVDH